MYRPSPASEQSDTLQRNALIEALKRELHQLRDKEHEYVALTDDAHNCEARHAMLQEERERKVNEQKFKADINRKNVSDLRSQADSLKMQIHKCSVSIEDVLRESTGLKRTFDNRGNEIAALMSSNQQLDARNQQIDQENKAISSKIRSLKEERNRIDAGNQALQGQLEQTIGLLKGLEKEARMIESSGYKLSSMLLAAEQYHSELISEMENREDMVSQTNQKLDQFNGQIEELRDKINYIEKESSRNGQELSKTTDQLEALTGKNREQSKRIKQAEGHFQKIEGELDMALLEKDSLGNENEDHNMEFKLLNSEIDGLLLQIIEYERANSEMKGEIESYIQYDEEARSMMDRKDAMRKMLETVTSRLGQTSSHIAHLR